MAPFKDMLAVVLFAVAVKMMDPHTLAQVLVKADNKAKGDLIASARGYVDGGEM